MQEQVTDHTSSTSQLLTIDDVGRILRLTPRQVYRLCKQDLLPKPIRLLSSVRWRASELESYLASQNK